MSTPRFIKHNQEFVCRQCGAKVPLHQSSSRDHCHQCLFSLHVDVYPGDRKNRCRGVLEPIGIIIKKGKQQVVYKCRKCYKDTLNIIAEDDNREKIIELTGQTLGFKKRKDIQ